MTARDALAQRVRRMLAEHPGVTDVAEQRMVGGGVGFMVHANLCVGATERGLTVRVGADARARALGEPHVGPLFVGQRQPKAFVVVDHDGLGDDAALSAWIDRGVTFVMTL